MSDHLHVFALNTDALIRHTELTRARGESTPLPALADWMALDGLDLGRIEVFPVSDLGEMALSDYVTMAFVPEAPLAEETAARLNALDGTVALVPSHAFTTQTDAGADAQEVAVVELAMPDHDAQMPKADLGALGWPGAEDDDEDDTSDGGRNWRKLAIGLAVALLFGLVILQRMMG